MSTNVVLYDTTLRDGAQCKDVNFSVQDKIKIALRLSNFGLDYIEAGMPSANSNDALFFQEILNYDLKKSKIAAFGSTHHSNYNVENDPSLKALIATKAEVFTIFGKSSKQHALDALNVGAERNIEIIRSSLSYAKKNCAELIFDAEHFFDGYKHDSAYAMAVIKNAIDSGADQIVLCDTNGGSLGQEILYICQAVRQAFPSLKLGIHCHNDCEMAVANTLLALEANFTILQGTINGIGERCGNANLCSIIPTLALKYSGINFQAQDNLSELSRLSNYVSEVANLTPFSRQAYVGTSAFAHKGGMHASAVNKNSELYEHIKPSLVGNDRNIIVSELGGRSNVISLAKGFGVDLDKDEPVVKGLMNELKKKSMQGYDYSAAGASVELLILRKLAQKGVREFFKLIQYRVLESKSTLDDSPLAEASVLLEVEGVQEHTAAIGLGPVNALDMALRKALVAFYPSVANMKLIDFKVRVFSNSGIHIHSNETHYDGTASIVRVLIESGDPNGTWVTVGVSHDIIEASWQALSDSVCYKLYREGA